MKKTIYKYASLIDGEVRYSTLGVKLSAPSDFLFIGEVEIDFGDDAENHAKLLEALESGR